MPPTRPPRTPPPWALRDAGLAAFCDADLHPSAHLGLPGEAPPLEPTSIGPGVFAGAVCSTVWCARVLAEVEAYQRVAHEEGWEPPPPNSMHEYGFDVAPLGLSSGLAGLVERWIRPFAERTYPWLPPLVEHNAFIVDYGREGDLSLDFHVDDSDVTMTLCLEEAEEGAELYFEGVRCGLHVDAPGRPEERLVVPHRAGEAIIHPGKNRHGVRPIRAGRRRNLVIWCRAEGSRDRWMADHLAGICPPWCGA